MKRLFIFFVLIVFVVSSVFSEEPTNQILFEGFHVNPTTLLDYTYYDYMNGGYNSFPMRIQKENIWGGELGIYFTFMAQALTGPRKQFYSYAEINSSNAEPAREFTHQYPQHSEGFGSLAIHPIIGNPIYAWHGVPHTSPANHPDHVNSYFIYDNSHWFGQGNMGFPDGPFVLANNVDRDEELKHKFIWPTVHVGPSPIPGKHRFYVFHMSSSLSFQENPQGVDGYTPSSTEMMSFADIGFDDFNNETIGDIIWVEKTFDYLERMHRWEPQKIHDVSEGGISARASMSYAVAEDGPYAGYVALVGVVSGRTDLEWIDDIMEPHNHIILLSKDFGETFENIGFLIETRPDEDWKPSYDPDFLATLDDDTYDLFIVAQEGLATDRDNWAWTPYSLNHKTASFDRFGKLHFPSMYSVSININYWLPQSVTTQMMSFCTETHEVYINHLVPRVYDQPHSVPFVFDLDNDGYIDVNYGPNGTTPIPFPRYVPMFYHDLTTDSWFNYNQMRMTIDNNGYMALMWIDATYAHWNTVNADWYPEYYQKPEIMLSITRDSGANWSEPFKMSYKPESFPELSLEPLSYTPAYVYPADRLIILNEDKVRLYFMYVDDFGWGSGHPQGDGPASGAAIRYTAMDFDISELPVNERENVIPKDHTMLAQNFPNPFNPSTTIRFNVPTNGNVKLNVYNIRGQLVNTLVDSNLPSGQHEVVWYGNDSNNRSVASGIYFYKIETNGMSETKRMVLMK